MTDKFTYKKIYMTKDLGLAIKNFRSENNIYAKSIVEKFNKASSYISKLERGEIKKIDSSFFIELCNFISNSDKGLYLFLYKISQNFTSLSDDTKIVIMNIDDLLVEHPITSRFRNDLKKYMEEKDISISDLTNKINSNEDIQDNPEYENAPINEWFFPDGNPDNAIIKLSVDNNYIEEILNGNIHSIHSIIADTILYSLYRLGNEEEPRILAYKKTKIYKISHLRNSNIKSITQDNIATLLEPDVSDVLRKIIARLEIMGIENKEYSGKRIKQMSNNMDEDLGFTFAFMSLNIAELCQKNKNTKQKFLNNVKDLIEKYTKIDEGIEIYNFKE